VGPLRHSDERVRVGLRDLRPVDDGKVTPDSYTLRIKNYDVAGRRIREIHDGILSSGRHSLAWDGRDESGHAVAAGIYLIGVTSETGSRMGSKVYKLR